MGENYAKDRRLVMDVLIAGMGLIEACRVDGTANLQVLSLPIIGRKYFTVLVRCYSISPQKSDPAQLSLRPLQNTKALTHTLSPRAAV